MKPEPCSTTPDDFVCKSIGFISPCPDCGHDDCHARYMQWEASRGITRPHPGCPVFDAAECRCMPVPTITLEPGVWPRMDFAISED